MNEESNEVSDLTTEENKSNKKRMKLSTGTKAVILIILILILDQVSKILVKTNMTIGESITVFNSWFYIRFIENPGMAFGIDVPGKLGKPLLTIFRIIAVSAIGWYMHLMVTKKARPGLIFFMALIFAGALGNIIDCTVYGLIFNESTYFTVASLFPEGGGYETLLHGNVVDMFYFPVISGSYPHWFPWLGGQGFIFFRPIFNVADSSISIGIIAILLFQKRYFSENSPVLTAKTESDDNSETSTDATKAEKPVNDDVSADTEDTVRTENTNVPPDVTDTESPETNDASENRDKKDKDTGNQSGS